MSKNRKIVSLFDANGNQRGQKLAAFVNGVNADEIVFDPVCITSCRIVAVAVNNDVFYLPEHLPMNYFGLPIHPVFSAGTLHETYGCVQQKDKGGM